jgi:hypothetical protein
MNPKRTLSWDDLCNGGSGGSSKGLTLSRCLEEGLSAEDLRTLQPDVGMWVKHKGVSFEDVCSMTAWPLHPVHDLRGNISDLASMHYPASVLRDLGITYAYLRDDMHMDDEWMRKAIGLGWVKLHIVLQASSNKKDFIKWYAKALAQGERSLKLDKDNAVGQGNTGVLDTTGLPTNAGKIPLNIQFDVPEDFETFTKAAELCAGILGDEHSYGNGKIVALMATHYMAHANTHAEGGPIQDVHDLLCAIEDAYGTKLAVQGTDKKWIPVRNKPESVTPPVSGAAVSSASPPPKKSPAALKTKKAK